MKSRRELPHIYYPDSMFVSRIVNPHRTAGGGGGGSTLLTGLSHWWDLNEASGNAIDATGNQNLTEENTVPTGSGTAPDGGDTRDFTYAASNGDRFTASAGNVWNSGSAVTFACWFKLDSTTPSGSSYILGHDAPNGYSEIFINAAGNMAWYLDGGFCGSFSVASTLWQCLVMTSTGPGGSDEIFIDNVSKDTASNGWEPGSAAFYLGARRNANPNFEGEMCSAAIWDRVLTADERAEFYNSGTNLRYADL